MTERKPQGMSFRSWIDQQIADAEERGVFENLPGAGKPLPRRHGEVDYGQAWLRDYARREGVAAEEFLPTPPSPPSAFLGAPPRLAPPRQRAARNANIVVISGWTFG